MAHTSGETLDPRIRRTRLLLQEALSNLLKKKEFDKISVQDITEEATVNRATFYDHYADKFSLLECMVGTRFHEMLSERQVHFDATCGSAMQAIALAVCDYLTYLQGPNGNHTLEPHMESAVIAVVRRTLLDGLKQYSAQAAVPPEMIAAAASWAVYGAAKEWVQTPNRCSADEVAQTVAMLVAPILHAAEHHPAPG